MKKGIESFLYLLAVAIVLIVVFSLLSGSFLAQPQGKVRVLKEFSLGRVGVAQDFVFRNIQLGDVKVGETQEELLRQVVEMDISQGVAGGTEESLLVRVSPAFLELSRGAKVAFSVLEANPIGNLKISWNGKEFYNSRPSGLTEFTIPRDFVKEENTLKVSAEGPGLMFWSATSYKVRNFRVFALVGPQKIVPFELLPSELQSFDRGEVAFFGSGIGRLEVRVNGIAIFSSFPAGPEKILFNLSSVPLNAGSNVLSFVSSGSNTLSGAGLKLFSLGRETAKSRSFSLTKEEVASVAGKKGRIDFQVEEILKSGVLTLNLNGKRLDIQIVQRGNNTVPFSPADLKEGENRLDFSGTGTWDIPQAAVGVE